MNTNSNTVTHTLANLTKTERLFLEYFYIQSYDSASRSNAFIPGAGGCFTRPYIRSICKKFGYGGTIHWIVRKQFGRRTATRGMYEIPELQELHELWQKSDIQLKIVTRAGETIYINRKNNVNQ